MIKKKLLIFLLLAGLLPFCFPMESLAQSGTAATRYRTTQISSAQILALSATPVSLVGAPGNGKVIVVDRIVFKMIRTATAYANGGALEFRYTNASGAKVSADIAASVVTTGGAGTEYNTVGGVVTSLTPVANAAVVINNATAAFITGTGTAVVTVHYRIVNVGV